MEEVGGGDGGEAEAGEGGVLEMAAYVGEVDEGHGEVFAWEDMGLTAQDERLRQRLGGGFWGLGVGRAKVDTVRGDDCICEV